MSMLKLKLKPFYDITITLSVAGAAAVTGAAIISFPVDSPQAMAAEGYRSVYQTRVTLPLSQPLH